MKLIKLILSLIILIFIGYGLFIVLSPDTIKTSNYCKIYSEQNKVNISYIEGNIYYNINGTLIEKNVLYSSCKN